MNPRSPELAAILGVAGILAVVVMGSANAQPANARVESKPPSNSPKMDCTGGNESTDHKSATKVVCFSVSYSTPKSAGVRGKDGDEGNVKNVSCGAPINGKRTCTLTVEVNDRR